MPTPLTLTVEAVDSGSPALINSTFVNVTVIPIYTPPLFSLSQYNFIVYETDVSGTIVGVVNATELRFFNQVQIIYGLIGTIPFVVEQATGIIRVNATMNASVVKQYDFTASATFAQTNFIGYSAIHVTVLGYNRAVPTAPSFSPSTVNIQETFSSLFLSSAFSSDADGYAPDNVVRYAITAGNTKNIFSINTVTGNITLNGAGAGCIGPVPSVTYKLTVTATDTPVGNVTVCKSRCDTYASSFNQNATFVASCYAGCNYAAPSLASCQTSCLSNGRPTWCNVGCGFYDGYPLQSSTNLTITIASYAVSSPVLSMPFYSASVVVLSATGVPVLAVSATDTNPCVGPLRYSFVIGGVQQYHDNYFAIDNVTGIITVYGSLQSIPGSSWNATIRVEDTASASANITNGTVSIAILNPSLATFSISNEGLLSGAATSSKSDPTYTQSIAFPIGYAPQTTATVTAILAEPQPRQPFQRL